MYDNNINDDIHGLTIENKLELWTELRLELCSQRQRQVNAIT
jgi:hypothetical protein